MDEGRPTVIDAHAAVQGDLRGRDAQVLGRFRGEIELTGRLVLGESALVEATVIADSAEIGGQFTGEIKVRSLVLLEKARVAGSVDTEVLSMREGAQLNGPVTAGAAPSRSSGASSPSALTSPPRMAAG